MNNKLSENLIYLISNYSAMMKYILFLLCIISCVCAENSYTMFKEDSYTMIKYVWDYVLVPIALCLGACMMIVFVEMLLEVEVEDINLS
jgi:hypothetical protein